MSGIDWSNAPEGATHRVPTGCWYKIENDLVWYWSSREDWAGPYPKKQYEDGSMEDMVRRPKLAGEWNGEGLPPVGTVCEVQHPDRPDTWCKCTILVWDSECAVFSADANYPFAYDGNGYPESFRPIRTPEQIAFDLRDKSAEELYLTINWNESPSTWANLSQSRRADYFKAIDAGWNKFEIIDEPKS